MERGSGRWIPVTVALVVLLVLAAGAWVLRTVDPAVASPFRPCRFLEMTGWQCPGCGMTRATHHLLNGRVDTAFYFNAFYVTTLPLLAVWAAWWLRRWWTEEPLSPRALRTNAWLGAGYLGCWLVFSVARNLPGWPLL